MTSASRARRTSVAALVPVLLAGAGAGCYQYQEAPLAAVRPASTVHVVLSSDASSALAPTIGPNATSIDGRVIAINDGSIRLAATQIARAVGPEEFLQGEPIDVPSRGALSISMRSFDRPRTLLAIGGILASVFLVHAASDQSGVVSVKGGGTQGTK